MHTFVQKQMHRVDQTIYIRCLYGIFGREITKYTVIYGVYVRFWPALQMHTVFRKSNSTSLELQRL
jgi:hypothetical protein